MDTVPWKWVLADLQKVVGQQESARLEFKSSRLLQGSRDTIIGNLSKSISALANTEGGTIVIGIKERREGKTRIADSIDEGIDATAWPPERFQQMVESNVSPYLTGMRFNRIAIDEFKIRYAIVISVPQGTTAYQASDHMYYGRSEYECKSLPDHEIRLRMFRGRIPRGEVAILSFGRKDNAVAFSLGLKNTGEINITELKIKGAFKRSNGEVVNEVDFSVKDGWKIETRSYSGLSDQHNPVDEMRVNVYPGDTYETCSTQSYLLQEGLIFDWTLYLANTLPISGSLDIDAVTKKPHDIGGLEAD